MKYLLKNLQVIDADSPYHGKKVDILLNDNSIESISSDSLNLSKSDGEVHDFEGSFISSGFCDLYVNIGDPGFEYREDITSVANAAIAGGFTVICATADNHPVTQTKAQIEYILNKSASTPVRILPVGAITENFDGKTPTEMYDMHHAGAIAFSDIPHSIQDSGVLLRALQYVQPFNGLIISMPYDQTLAGNGLVNESEVSVKMGMPGITNLSEYSIIQRDIELLKYSGGKLHLVGISTKEGIDLIRKAKKEGLNITCSVFVHHLVSDESEVKDFDSNFKVFPPLRSRHDQHSLIKALQDGTIDCISTQHTPLNIDSKNVEFEYADFGMIGLETAFGLLNKKFGDILSKEKLLQLLSLNPRKIINFSNSVNPANSDPEFVILNFDEEWELKEKDIRSKSKNTPYLNLPLKGKIKAVYVKGKLITVGQ